MGVSPFHIGDGGGFYGYPKDGRTRYPGADPPGYQSGRPPGGGAPDGGSLVAFLQVVVSHLMVMEALLLVDPCPSGLPAPPDLQGTEGL